MTQNKNRGGIVATNITHRFRVLFRRDFIDTSETHLDFMAGVSSVNVDLLNKTVSIVCRDDVLGLVGVHIARCLKVNDSYIQIDHMSPDGDTVDTRKGFYGCVATSHSFDLDYGVAEPVMHKLVFKYKAFETHTPAPLSASPLQKTSTPSVDPES